MRTWLTSDSCPGAEALAVAPPLAAPAMALPPVALAPAAGVLAAGLLATVPPAVASEAAVAEDGRGEAGVTAVCAGPVFGLPAAPFIPPLPLPPCGPSHHSAS